MIDQITDMTSYVDMYGNHVSHNSYNSPLEVNTFKWDQKKEVTVTGNNGSAFSSTITNAEYNYCDAFAGLIKMHSQIDILTCDHSISKVEDFMGEIGHRWWSRDGQTDLSNCIAIRVNKTLIFCAVGPINIGADDEYLGCDPTEIAGNRFNYGASEWKDTYHLFPKDLNFIQVSYTA